MARTHHQSLTVLTLLTTGLVAGCTFDGGGADGGDLDGGVGGVGASFIGVGGSDEPGTGGASTGGASTGGGFGCDAPVPPVTVLCAGYYFESSTAGRALGTLNTAPGPSACGEPVYGTGGAVGVGGSPGGSTGGGGWGGAVEEEIAFDEEGTGGVGVGGVGGCDGDVCGTGGAPHGAGGGLGIGGGSGWCDGLGWDESLAGISFGAGACQKSELALPLVYNEPFGFYHLRVYAGSVACERGALLTEVAGYGTGATVSLPVTPPGEGFVSLELTADGYVYADMTFGLNPLGAAGDLGSE